MTLDIDKEVNEIVTLPVAKPPINWLLVSSVAFGTILTIIAIGWFTGFVNIGSSRRDSGADDTAITNTDTPRIKGNRMSRIYHLPRCMNYNDISPQNIRWFNNEENAKAAGYRRARNC